MKIIVIRRDNIGDLVCTTPLFAALHESFPDAHIAAFVNSYNAPVLAGNNNIDKIYSYKKAKHYVGEKSRKQIFFETIKLIYKLRKEKWDYAIVASTKYSRSALKFAKSINADRIIAFADKNSYITDPIKQNFDNTLHQTQALFKLLAPLGIYAEPGPLQVFPQKIRSSLADHILDNDMPIIGMHISSRLLNQRWPIENFANLARELYKIEKANILVFWSPGDTNNPQHPGDDYKSRKLQSLANDIPLTLFPTKTIEELIAGMSLCNRIICSDGGAMHLAAGLGKPIICMFGDSSTVHWPNWYPWGVPYELLHKDSGKVSDISVEDVLSANRTLLDRLNLPTTNPDTV